MKLKEIIENNILIYFYVLLFFNIFAFTEIASRFPFLQKIRWGLLLFSLGGIFLLKESIINFKFINKIRISISIFVLWTFISLLFGDKSFRSFEYAIVNSIAFFLIFFLLPFKLSSTNRIYLFFKGIILVHISFILFSIPFFIFNFFNLNFIKIAGVFINRNALAELSVIAFVFIVLIIEHKAYENRLLMKIALILSAMSIFLTDSRNAILCFFIGLFLLKKKFVKSEIILYISTLCLLFLRFFKGAIDFVLNILFTIINKFNITGSNSISTVSIGSESSYKAISEAIVQTKLFANQVVLYSRTIVWKTSYDLFKQNFLHGIGLGAYINGIKYFTAGYSTHNVYLEILIELGIIGFVLFLFMVLPVIFKSFIFVIKNSDSEEKRLVKDILIILFVFAVYSSFESTFLLSGNFMFFSFWSLILCLDILVEKKDYQIIQ